LTCSDIASLSNVTDHLCTCLANEEHLPAKNIVALSMERTGLEGRETRFFSIAEIVDEGRSIAELPIYVVHTSGSCATLA
jgi:hypothetical protein